MSASRLMSFRLSSSSPSLLVLASVFILSSQLSHAHSINLDCSQVQQEVQCKGGFSDGSGTSNLPYVVISYNDDVLAQGHSSEQSTFTFPLPEQDYYILLDAGPGHVVELDMQDVAKN
ncbi:hypothetical protein [Oceanospirillum beijerinckii]|uniref:hypothetical protein n=1 Tax=Oceanospirillum beijerinckii TaxID=64976 RepID=UPI000684FE13|nr:hypothetical protein [Oceanospirillum beijerinckii]